LLIVAIWVSAVLAALTLVAAVAKAALEANDEESAKAESLSFVRLSLTGVFGVVVGEAFAPIGLAWWWSVGIAVFLMFTLLLGSQLASRRLGHRAFGLRLAKVFGPAINSIHPVSYTHLRAHETG
jgi:hypothetical protein